MPRACSVCKHPQSAEITRAIGKGGSLRALAVQYGLPHHAAVHRHKVQCMGIKPKSKSAAPVALATVPKPSRNAADDPDALDPRSLLRRASGLLDATQAIIDRARASGDDRLGLQAQRELRESLNLAMKAIGMMQDGGVVIDQRKIEVRAFSERQETEFLRACAEGRVAITGGTVDQEPEPC